MNNKQEPTKPKLRIKIKGGKKILLDSSFLSQNNKIENHYTETKTQKNDKVPHFMTPTKSSLLFSSLFFSCFFPVKKEYVAITSEGPRDNMAG